MTSKDYLLNVNNIVSVYENWGLDISTLLSIYINTNPDVYKTFLSLYKWEDCNYKRKDLKQVRYFYEKLSKLLVEDYKYYVEFSITPIQRKYKDLEYKKTFYQKRRDYLLALLLLSEGFLNKGLTSKNIDSYKSGLFAKDDSAVFSLNANKEEGKSLVQLAIPNIVIVNYDAYKYNKQKVLKK